MLFACPKGLWKESPLKIKLNLCEICNYGEDLYFSLNIWSQEVRIYIPMKIYKLAQLFNKQYKSYEIIEPKIRYVVSTNNCYQQRTYLYALL